jgi:chromosome segregation ATPase
MSAVLFLAATETVETTSAASSWISAVIVLTILVFFGAGVWMYLRRLWITAHAFRTATNALADGPPSTNPFPAAATHLRGLWAKFLKNREHTTVPYRGQDISTFHPEEVFTEAAVLDGYNRHMAFTFAGFFTGLGILGTFLGLVVGLRSITLGADPTAIMNSVMGLLGGMHAAFYTSVAGIFFSLVWLFADRTLLYEVHREAQRFLRTAEKIYPVENADRILHRLLNVEEEESEAIHKTNEILLEQGQLHAATRDILRNSHALAEEQKAILQNLGTDIATAVIGTLSPITTGIQEAVAGISTTIGENQAKLMSDLLTSFQEGLTERLDDHFVRLAEALQKTAEWQEHVHGELSALMEQVQNAAGAQTEAAKRGAELVSSLNAGAEALGSAQESIATAAVDLRGMAGELTAGLKEAADNVSRIGAGLVESVERIDLQARALEERIRELDSQHEGYREANEELRVALANQIDAVTEQVESLNGYWTQFRDDLDTVGMRLRESVEEFSVFSAEKLREIFARFDAEMATVVQHLSGTLAEVREVTEDLPASVERFRGSLVDGLAPIREAGAVAERLPEVLTEIRALTDAVHEVAPLRNSLDRAASGIVGTEQAVGVLSTRLSAAEDRLVQVLRVFQEGDGNGRGPDTTRRQPPSPPPISP